MFEGLVEALNYYYTRFCPAGVTSFCLSAPTSHVCSRSTDRLWGCGYRNLQMGISSLLRLKPYADMLVTLELVDDNCNLPNIPLIQEIIQLAWSIGMCVWVSPKTIVTTSISLISYHYCYFQGMTLRDVLNLMESCEEPRSPLVLQK